MLEFHSLQGPVAQSGSAPRSHRGGQGFESPQVHAAQSPCRGFPVGALACRTAPKYSNCFRSCFPRCLPSLRSAPGRLGRDVRTALHRHCDLAVVKNLQGHGRLPAAHTLPARLRFPQHMVQSRAVCRWPLGRSQVVNASTSSPTSVRQARTCERRLRQAGSHRTGHGHGLVGRARTGGVGGAVCVLPGLFRHGHVGSSRVCVGGDCGAEWMRGGRPRGIAVRRKGGGRDRMRGALRRQRAPR